MVLVCEFTLKIRKLKTDHQKLADCGQGMWIGESHPGSWAGSGCHGRIPESPSEVSSPRWVSFSTEDPPVSSLGRVGVGWGSRAARFQGPHWVMGLMTFLFTLCVKPDHIFNSASCPQVQGLWHRFYLDVCLLVLWREKLRELLFFSCFCCCC